MICPKCGFEQPAGAECLRCGIVFNRYQGPILGEAAPPLPAPPPPLPLSASLPAPAASSTYASPQPAMAAAADGTLYGGTMYDGPPPGAVQSGAVGRPVRGSFEVGKILGQSFSIYFSNFVPFTILTLLALSPLLIFSAWVSSVQPDPALDKLAPHLSNLIRLLCVPMATAATTYGTFNQMRGGSPTLIDCLKVGLSTFLPMLGLALVQGLVVGLASLLCLIPGILLYVRWAVAIPAAVEERPGLQGALNRSTYLTDGYRWPIFGALALLFILNMVLLVILMAVFGVSAMSSGPFLFASSLLDVLSVGVTATATAVMYYRLRSLKESIDVDQIASVFA